MVGMKKRSTANALAIACAVAITALLVSSTFSRSPTLSTTAGKEEKLTSSRSSGSLPTVILPKTTKSILINLGANVDPILPAKQAGPCAKVLAFEPMVADSIPPHPQVYVVTAAVSSQEGILKMEKYNNGLSSSFSKPAANSAVFQNKEGVHVRMVPTYSLTSVIQAIPDNVSIDLVFTDIQGYDFSVIASAIDTLRERKVAYIYSEVTVENVRTYVGVENDFCRHWLPFMESHGYTFVEAMGNAQLNLQYNPPSRAKKTCARELATKKPAAGIREMDVLWRLADLDPTVYKDKTAQEQLNERTFGRWRGQESLFTPNEYASCE